MVASLRRRSGRESSQVKNFFNCLLTWKIVVVAMLGNTRRSRVVTSIPSWTSLQSLTVCTIQKSHLQSQKENCKYQEKGWLPLWLSRPKQGRKNTKRQGMPSNISVRRTFLRLLRILRKCRNYLMRRRGPNMSLLIATFIKKYSLRSVWWDLITSMGTIMAVIRKWMLRLWTLIFRTKTNQNSSSCTKVYRRIVIRT